MVEQKTQKDENQMEVAQMALYSIVVPVYNSEKTLCELFERVKVVFEEQIHEDFEMILVDDFSKDNSFSVMEQLHEKDKRVKIIQLSKNCGQHNALLCGFAHASGDFIITVDDDLQHPPEEIPKLVTHLTSNDNLDAVIGTYAEKKHSLYRNIGSKMSGMVGKISGKNTFGFKMTSFRIIRANIVKLMLSIHISTPRIGYLLTQVTSRVGNVIVRHDSRKFGRSQYTLKRLIKDFSNSLFTNTVFPLKIVRNLGIFSCFFSIGLSIFYLIRYLAYGISVTGWITIVLLLLMFSGIILFSIGILGEYLMRVLEEAKKVPNYHVRNKKM